MKGYTAKYSVFCEMMERNVAVLPHRIRSHDDLRFRTSSVHGTCPSSLAEACLRHDGVGAGEGPEEAEEVHHKAPAWARWSLECKLELYIYIYILLITAFSPVDSILALDLLIHMPQIRSQVRLVGLLMPAFLEPNL